MREVELPRAFDDTLVAGQRDDVSGLAWLSAIAPPGGYELRLEPRSPLVIEVHDHRGQPVPGAPVILIRSRSAQHRTTHRLGRTDRHGQLRAPLAGLVFGTGGLDALVGVIGIGLAATAVSVDLAAPPRAPLRITLPPTARGQVRVAGCSSAPLDQIEPQLGASRRALRSAPRCCRCWWPAR